MKNASEIKVNSITKETEKAICVNVEVCWNNGNGKSKDIWFPKSTCEIINVNGEIHAVVADWMMNKTCIANTFHGYQMYFCYCNNSRFARF